MKNKLFMMIAVCVVAMFAFTACTTEDTGKNNGNNTGTTVTPAPTGTNTNK